MLKHFYFAYFKVFYIYIKVKDITLTGMTFHLRVMYLNCINNFSIYKILGFNYTILNIKKVNTFTY